MNIQKIAVVGAGTMGHGIAQIAAQAGYTVYLNDVNDEIIKKAIGKIDKNCDRLVQKGKMTEDDKRGILSRIEACPSLTQIANADLIIEAVSENEEIKKQVFKDLDALAKTNTIIATNTSSISITLLAAQTKRPDKIVGMHFFNPVPVMQLVEIIRGLQTSDETFATAFQVSEKLGKVPAAIKDSAAFAVNRILIPMVNEAIYVLYEGIADAATIDKTMKLGCNHPMGPLELADFVGLDVLLGALDVMGKNLGAKYHPCPLLRKYVEAGYLGRKTGRGFFDYSGK